jgi:glutamine synthetase
MGFIERHGLWSDEARRQADEVTARIERDGIELVRFSFPDLHGILRGKALTALAVPSAPSRSSPPAPGSAMRGCRAQETW